MSALVALIARVEKIVSRELERIEKYRGLGFPLTEEDNRNLERYTKQLLSIEAFKSAQRIIPGQNELESLSDKELHKMAFDILKTGGLT